MANNINSRIDKLRARRSGADRLERISEDARQFIANKRISREAWESRASGKPFTRYAIGSMQAVDPDYTRISIDTGRRVENQLRNRLTKNGLAVDFRLQGSVPLDVHIRGVSDVDLLVLDTSFLVYATDGVKAHSSYYLPSPKNSLSVLLNLRSEVERELPLAFYAADVDVTGSKAVKISGGSLARPVDVVPSHWWDTTAYQASAQESDRGVKILDKDNYETPENLPFLHIKRVTERCNQVAGGLRKAIRLCKNLKADAIDDGRKINLSSFDLVSTLYHADQDSLRLGYIYELAVLAETQRHISYLVSNPAYAKTLRVPDNSRFIFDDDKKLIALAQLLQEINELLQQVAKEQRTVYNSAHPFTYDQDRTLLKSALYF